MAQFSESTLSRGVQECDVATGTNWQTRTPVSIEGKKQNLNYKAHHKLVEYDQGWNFKVIYITHQI